MKNADYTCDCCGAQVYTGEAYMVSVGKMTEYYSVDLPIDIRKELCRKCAKSIIEVVNKRLKEGGE